MKKPFRLLVKRDELSLHGIQQFYVAVDKDGTLFFFRFRDELVDPKSEIP
jgi:hypothetical protein